MKLVKNMGPLDKKVRLVLGIALILSYFIFSGGLKWLSILGVVFVATSLMGFCPLYLPFKINTLKKK